MSFFARRLPRPRRFSYEPRYYDPKPDEDLRRRMRLARRARPRRRGPSRLVLFVLLLAVAAYLYAGPG